MACVVRVISCSLSGRYWCACGSDVMGAMTMQVVRVLFRYDSSARFLYIPGLFARTESVFLPSYDLTCDIQVILMTLLCANNDQTVMFIMILSDRDFDFGIIRVLNEVVWQLQSN